MKSEYSKDTVIQIISCVQERLEDGNSEDLIVIKQVLSRIKEILYLVRAELGVKASDFPGFSDELASTVKEAEDATNSIIDTTMTIQSIVREAKVNKDVIPEVDEKINVILESCSFQDITGQRINKVISYMDKIESEINAVMALLSHDDGVEDLKNKL